jgi:hypothetical protein
MKKRMLFTAVLGFIISITKTFGAGILLGYDLNYNVGGLAHSLAVEADYRHLESGLALGYGAKPIWEEITTPAAGGRNQVEVRMHHATALRVDIPVRVKFHAWPYPVGGLCYEHILQVPQTTETSAEGYAKSNDFALYYGAGWGWFFHAFGFQLEGALRSQITESNKSRFFKNEAPNPISTYRFESARGGFSGNLFWRVSLRYRFSAPST